MSLFWDGTSTMIPVGSQVCVISTVSCRLVWAGCSRTPESAEITFLLIMKRFLSFPLLQITLTSASPPSSCPTRGELLLEALCVHVCSHSFLPQYDCCALPQLPLCASTKTRVCQCACFFHMCVGGQSLVQSLRWLKVGGSIAVWSNINT